MAENPERAYFEPDDIVRSQDGGGKTFADILTGRLSRRGLLKAGFLAGLAASPLARALSREEAFDDGLGFAPIAPTTMDRIQVAEGYRAQVVVRWGDPIKPEAPDFDPEKQSPEAQRQQFGYNNDFIGFLPLPFGSQNSSHGLLAVNHEYTNAELMFPVAKPTEMSEAQTRTCMEAEGFAVVEIKLDDRGEWQVVRDSRYNTRFSATSTFEVTGPALGHDRMKTKRDPAGHTSVGTFANCAAGKTPWGTVLSAEENFQDYYANSAAVTDARETRSHERYGIPKEASEYGWERFWPDLDLKNEPHGPYQHGWVVEFDPYDPDWTPKKRTSLGRFRHEAATTYVAKNNRVVMYSGDDARFEYVYKFVCDRPFQPNNREANRDLVDEGTLYVAVFNEDGTGEWRPLKHGHGPLTAENGFKDQGEVMIDVRIAADLLGATKMDRPEDIEVNPVNKKVYVVCTNNTDRGKDGKATPDKMNPRSENKHGHIIEITEAGDDHTATTFAWEMFMVCGDPADEATYFAGFDRTKVSPISCPDNVAFDAKGNLWIATDGMSKTLKVNDAFYAVPVQGPNRGRLQMFMSSVPAAEVCGPEFTPDGTTVFLAIQHPAEGSKFGEFTTIWPDGSGLPRPSVIAIRAEDGRVIGAKPTGATRRDLLGLKQ